MTEPDWLVAGFEENRARLRGVSIQGYPQAAVSGCGGDCG
jgi:hypothetical protein